MGVSVGTVANRVGATATRRAIAIAGRSETCGRSADKSRRRGTYGRTCRRPDVAAGRYERRYGCRRCAATTCTRRLAAAGARDAAVAAAAPACAA